MDRQDLVKLQEDARREVENTVLNTATDMRDFISKRAEMRKLVLHPDLPRDEMTAADYCRVRKNDRDPLGRKIR